MKLDLLPLVKNETKEIEFDFSQMPEQNSLSDITFEDGVNVKGSVTNSSGYMRLEMRVFGRYKTGCARCMTEHERELDARITKDVALKEMLEDPDSDDYLVCEDSKLDLDEAIEELMYLELPTRVLCREDCKGLCPKCGRNLNEGGCGCDLSEPDPRWAALKNYFKENK